MYSIIMTAAALTLINFAAGEANTYGFAPLWVAIIAFGGSIIGHVITNVLDAE